MSDSIFSPDGKFMWTGSEWIPAPPQSEVISSQNIDQDKVETVASEHNIEKEQLEQVAPYFDLNKDGVLQQSELEQAAKSVMTLGARPSVKPGEHVPNYQFQQGSIAQPSVGITSPMTVIQQPKSNSSTGWVIAGMGLMLGLFIAAILLVNSTLGSGNSVTDLVTDWDGDGISDANDPDDDNDGINDENDWFDEGDGGLKIEFTEFRIWSGGSYDSGGGDPDVYAYVGIGDGNCDNMQYFEYLDDINEDASELYNWEEKIGDVPDDDTSACVEVLIYDEDSWAPDEILDFVPGSANYYSHSFNLAAGQGDVYVYEDNRGENELSILLEYEISRVGIVPA